MRPASMASEAASLYLLCTWVSKYHRKKHFSRLWLKSKLSVPLIWMTSNLTSERSSEAGSWKNEIATLRWMPFEAGSWKNETAISFETIWGSDRNLRSFEAATLIWWRWDSIPFEVAISIQGHSSPATSIGGHLREQYQSEIIRGHSRPRPQLEIDDKKVCLIYD